MKERHLLKQQKTGNYQENDGKKIIETTTKKYAPALIPSVLADANGLFVNVCKTAPATASAPPAKIPIS